ncbi:hypothetical protein [Natronococcus sp. A-GB7]|uniref:hypothetical protein n=1 Tax=Natronococcus sp. A-GB7 TaxID=3037649 RepID=UPI00241F9487|nr:hypothetical protein [Natronococcus sp. A-GB7]MDG5821883.1 hypothetical protein [Natronococcus sp. A-GB7]
MKKQFSGTEISRRNVLRMIGSGGAASIVGSSTAYAATAKEDSIEPITGENLGEVVREVAAKDDIINVMGRAWSETVRSTHVSEVPHDEHPQHDDLFDGKGPEKMAPHAVDTADEITVYAVDKELDDGNKVTSVAFETEDRVISYHEYEKVHNAVQTIAQEFQIQETENKKWPTVSIEDRSVNGEEPVPVTEVTNEKSDDDLVANSDCEDPCGGCYGAPPGASNGQSLHVTCSGSFDIDCALNSLGCGWCKTSCTPATIGVCVTCIVIFCGIGVVRSCCDETVTDTCVECGCGSCGVCDEIT